MDDEDLNGRLSFRDSGSGSGKSKPQYQHSVIDSQPCNSEHTEDKRNSEFLKKKGDSDHENTHCISGAELKKDFVDNDSDSDMEIEDMDSLSVPLCSHRDFHTENNVKSANADPQPSDVVDKDKNLENEKLCLTEGYVQTEDGEFLPEMSLGQDLVDSQSTLQVNEFTETITVTEELEGNSSRVHAESGCPSLRDESPNRSHTINQSSISGVKRARITVDEHQSSVHVVYNSLTRASRQKLEELLQQWSEWHAKHVSLSKDPGEVLESGEETFFPALHVGLQSTSAVSFWMDNLTREEQNKEFIPLDGNSVPLYDRGYALGLTSADGSTSNVEGGLEIVDTAARCFNCGSYNHSLRECPRPRDNVAVSSARKQHKSKRNQNSASRNPTRYYQNTPAGKYDGLRPGALDAETRQLLGLGELDPPPWLNRMREVGYPPGYLDVDDEPSGIMIYVDGESAEQEDGEIIEVDYSKPKRKMTVKFPGINAPIPENADEILWAAGPSNAYPSRNRLQHRLNYSTDHASRGHYREQRMSRDYRDDGPPGDSYREPRSTRDYKDDGPPGDPYHEPRLSRDYRDDGPSGDPYREPRLSRVYRDDGPPGDPYREERLSRDYRDDGPPGDPEYASSKYSFHPRYDSYDSKHNPRDSQSDRSRRSSLDDEGYRKSRSFHSLYYSDSR
ncbi:hypothetical protein L6164_006531 [Bauhinia variegata]|uniref:Uncharacterized protein n=1 Tax=Bauhinia variegata TaxID=167791 RepID=A0ACB9PWT0_BAUVA|nr:hypothetical protein L6164_006531 [Bauhinia variegata]